MIADTTAVQTVAALADDSLTAIAVLVSAFLIGMAVVSAGIILIAAACRIAGGLASRCRKNFAAAIDAAGGRRRVQQLADFHATWAPVVHHARREPGTPAPDPAVAGRLRRMREGLGFARRRHPGPPQADLPLLRPDATRPTERQETHA
ncbi:MAG TPA: hypothetical protein VMW52_03555 [Phycisphaerae bacterium]|nr:hypothetical protein [Phycisphaerae bacterium]